MKRIAAERAAGSDRDRVRFEILRRFGFYNTESSEHTAEYSPYFIKKNHPELIDRFEIPLDEYPRRCEAQIAGWEEMREKLAEEEIVHQKSHEFAAFILGAALNDRPCRIHGNVVNRGLISNLPDEACVEVPCLVDRNGVQPCRVGALPEQLAALNRTNINVQLLTIQAIMTRKKDYIYHAAMLDPHTSSELSIDDIVAMCDDLIEAHGDWLPKYN